MYRPGRASITAENVQDLGVKAKEDPDMQRATDLVELHCDLKIKHIQGEDAGLEQARKDVDTVLDKLRDENHEKKRSRG